MKKGFMLIEVMIAIIMAGILAAVLATIGYYTLIQGNTLKQQNSKTILEVIRSRLLNSAANPDSDSYFELLKEDTNNTVPVVIGLGKDAWGHNVYYSTYDFGDANGNSTYAQNTTSISPNANVLGRLISRGENGILDTDASHSVAQNDDIMLEIGIGETNHLKLYNGSEVSTQTRGYNSAIVSVTEPASPIHGTLWYSESNSTLYMYNTTDGNWTKISP
jgi:prepilin-type N-terminal cleavage/methylation domain-containing protein